MNNDFIGSWFYVRTTERTDGQYIYPTQYSINNTTNGYVNLGGYVLWTGEKLVQVGTTPEIDTNNIVDGAVTTDKIADNTIVTDKIADKAINSDKLQLGSITSGKIQDGAVSTGKIADKAISANKLQAGSVTSGKIQDRAVSTGKIEPSSTKDRVLVTTETGGKKVVSWGQVQNWMIAEGTIALDRLALGEQLAGWLEIGLTNGYMPVYDCRDANLPNGWQVNWCRDNGIYVGGIQKDCGGHPPVINNNHTSWVVITLNGMSTDADSLNHNHRLQIAFDLVNSKIYMRRGWMSANTWANNWDEVGKIADGSITTDKLGGYAVTTDKLEYGAVTSSKLADRAVTTGKLITGAVTTEKLADGAITKEKLSSDLLELISTGGNDTPAARSIPSSNEINVGINISTTGTYEIYPDTAPKEIVINTGDSVDLIVANQTTDGNTNRYSGWSFIVNTLNINTTSNICIKSGNNSCPQVNLQANSLYKVTIYHKYDCNFEDSIITQYFKVEPIILNGEVSS